MKVRNERRDTSEFAEEHIERALDLALDKPVSLEPGVSDIDFLWAQEAENRLDAYERGEIKAIPAEKVADSIRNRKP